MPLGCSLVFKDSLQHPSASPLVSHPRAVRPRLEVVSFRIPLVSPLKNAGEGSERWDILRQKTYSQNWPAYNAAQTTEKSHLQALRYELCRTIAEPVQQRGRPRLSLADIIFARADAEYDEPEESEE